MKSQIADLEKLKKIEKLAGRGKKAVPRLLELSTDEDEEVRFRAVDAFQRLSPEKLLVDRARTSLDDPDELVRTAAIEALGEWRDKGSVELLYRHLSDASDIVRSAAIASIGEIGRKDSVWVLERIFQTSVGSDRLAAAAALCCLAKEQYIDTVLDFLKEPDYQLRCAAANLLGECVAPSDVPRVLMDLKRALLQEKTKAARSSLVRAIANLSHVAT